MKRIESFASHLKLCARCRIETISDLENLCRTGRSLILESLLARPDCGTLVRDGQLYLVEPGAQTGRFWEEKDLAQCVRVAGDMPSDGCTVPTACQHCRRQLWKAPGLAPDTILILCLECALKHQRQTGFSA